MMECNLYNDERERLFNVLDINIRDGNKEEIFKDLFRKNWKEVILYLKYIWKKRQDKLFR